MPPLEQRLHRAPQGRRDACHLLVDSCGVIRQCASAERGAKCPDNSGWAFGGPSGRAGGGVRRRVSGETRNGLGSCAHAASCAARGSRFSEKIAYVGESLRDLQCGACAHGAHGEADGGAGRKIAYVAMRRCMQRGSGDVNCIGWPSAGWVKARDIACRAMRRWGQRGCGAWLCLRRP
jgi:hypothetical protein